MSTLPKDLADLVTEIQALQISNDDPLRHAKRRAKEDACAVVFEAVARARRLLELPALIQAGADAVRAECRAVESGRG